MSANEGLPRRFPYRYTLPDYSNTELTDILMNTLIRKIPNSIEVDEETSNYVFSIVKKLAAENTFPNQAGDMLNLATSLNKAIGSSFRVKWENGNLENNTAIILSGFEDFWNLKFKHFYFSLKLNYF